MYRSSAGNCDSDQLALITPSILVPNGVILAFIRARIVRRLRLLPRAASVREGLWFSKTARVVAAEGHENLPFYYNQTTYPDLFFLLSHL